jgi:hypothetical protein
MLGDEHDDIGVMIRARQRLEAQKTAEGTAADLAAFFRQ